MPQKLLVTYPGLQFLVPKVGRGAVVVVAPSRWSPIVPWAMVLDAVLCAIVAVQGRLPGVLETL